MTPAESERTPPAVARVPRRGAIVAAASLFLAAAVLFGLSRDIARRARVDRFVALSGLAAVRPLEAASIALESEPDLAAAAAVSIAIHDAGAPSGAREEKWRSLARELAEDDLASRPGWAMHAHLLAEVAYRESRAAGERVPPAAWMTAWREATRASPAVALFRSRRALACLEAWPTLPKDLHAGALEAIRSALIDPEFVALHFRGVTDLVGVDNAIGLLPDHAEPIRAAAAALADRSLDRAKGLLDRADATEAAHRSDALVHLEDLARGRGGSAPAEACRAFVTAFPVERLDERGRQDEAARLLAVWPSERGAWDTDARASLVLNLLSGGKATADRPALRRAVASLSGVPQPVTADVLDMTGDHANAEKVRNSAAASEPGAGDWVSYDLRSARRALIRGDATAARAALNRLPSGRLQDCDALLVRRDLARRSGDAAGTAEAERHLAELDRDGANAERWHSTGRLRMCIDPAGPAGRSLVVSLVASAPAIVVYGWDRSRAGTRLVTAESVLTLPLAGKSGVREFWFAALAGGPVSPREPTVR